MGFLSDLFSRRDTSATPEVTPFPEAERPVPPAVRRFAAAQQNRLTADWLATQLSADESLRRHLGRLIDRSRDLEESNEYYAGYLGLVERNVVGPQGIKLQMRIAQPDGKGGLVQDKAANDLIETAWRDWCRKDNCFITRDMTFRDGTRIASRTVARDGAFLFRKITGRAAGNKYGYALQALEIDHLDPMLNKRHGDNEVRMGVERNAIGKVVALHLLTAHPGDFNGIYNHQGRRYERIPAEQIIHPFIRKRFGQSRGYPQLAASMLGLRMLLGYKEAELVAARVSACKMGFFSSPDGDKYKGEEFDENGNPIGDTGPEIDGEPGTFGNIGSHTFQAWDPQHPVQAFGDFVKECLRGFAVCGGAAYHNVTGDMNGVNYSSARIAELGEREGWKMWQEWMIDYLMTDVFEDWLFHALGNGAIAFPVSRKALPLSKFDIFNQPRWFGRRWQWVDPTKEVKAAIDAIDNGLNSPKRHLAEQGLDEEEIYEEIEGSQERRAKLLRTKTAPAPLPPEQPPPVDTPTEEDS